MPSSADRRARTANTLVFFMTGAVGAAWSTRIPAIKEALHLSPGALGAAILGLEAGAIVGLPAGGALVARAGSPRALRVGFLLFPLALFGVSLAGGAASLAAALAAMAAATSLIDVAMNAQGVELERRYGRPVLSGMHAGHPFGLAAGGVLGTLAAAAGVPVRSHFALTAVAGVIAGLGATRWLVRERGAEGRPALARPSRPLVLLGLVAFCAFLLDGAAYNWSAVHLRTERGAGPGLAAAAFTLFSLTLGLGRLAGDRLVARLGRVRVVQGCGVVAAAGAALAAAAPQAAPTLAGWMVFGLGLAALAPTVLGAAPGVADVPAPVAIATVTTIGYLGSFTGPPAIGALAQLTSLDTALGLVVVVGLGAALVAPLALATAGRLERPPTG